MPSLREQIKSRLDAPKISFNSPFNYHDHFTIDDVIEITNTDRPEWCNGKWRVADVGESRVIVQPLTNDEQLDTQRDEEAEYVIENGGFAKIRRGNPDLRIGQRR